MSLAAMPRERTFELTGSKFQILDFRLALELGEPVVLVDPCLLALVGLDRHLPGQPFHLEPRGTVVHLKNWFAGHDRRHSV